MRFPRIDRPSWNKPPGEARRLDRPDRLETMIERIEQAQGRAP